MVTRNYTAIYPKSRMNVALDPHLERRRFAC
jgi:hypothetical protein